MECCVSHPPMSMKWPLPSGCATAVRPRNEKPHLLELLAWLVSPEPTDGYHSHLQPAAWQGPVKSLFWMAAAIGLGVLLAMVCH